MKKGMIIAGVLVIAIILVALMGTGRDVLLSINETDLQEMLAEKRDGVIFCYQETCRGCGDVEKDLTSILQKKGGKCLSFEVSSQNSKEILYEYGLSEVPAVIIISSGQVNVYKGDLSYENLKRVIESPLTEKDRISEVQEITFEEFMTKKSSPKDFFVLFGSKLCSDCIQFDGVLSQLTQEKENHGVYYIDIDTMKESMTEADYDAVMDEYAIQWIPYLLHIRNGVIVSYYEYPNVLFRGNESTEGKNEEIDDFYKWFDDELK